MWVGTGLEYMWECGLVAPITVAVAGSDGLGFVCFLEASDGGLDVRMLAEDVESDAPAFPLMVLFHDTTGRAVNLIMQ